MKKSILIISALCAFVIKADTLELPRSVNGSAIYHIKTQQLDDYCCGYNALFNACNMENCCGIPNKASDYMIFDKVCRQYVQQEGLNPHDSVGNRTLDALHKLLGMQTLCQLSFYKQKIVPIFSTPTPYTYFEGTSDREIERISEAAIEKRSQEFLTQLKSGLERNGVYKGIIHFICIVKARGEDHGILITLVQNQTGCGLYIFDNLNIKIDDRSETRQYIDFLCKMFYVSPKHQFKGPQLPASWRTTPGPRNGKYVPSPIAQPSPSRMNQPRNQGPTQNNLGLAAGVNKVTQSTRKPNWKKIITRHMR